MRKFLAACLAVAGLTATGAAAVIPAPRSGDVVVNATYKGKGPVDEKHAILVFLFDHPNPTGERPPLAVQPITKNGGTATFKAVTANPVYVTVVYDEKSNYDGRNGPPPSGTPIGSYMKGGKPVAVVPGPAAKVTAVFDDSIRWK
jgi:hypothetical protein